jgi:hypothetical protein
MEEPGEQSTVVFASIVPEPASERGIYTDKKENQIFLIDSEGAVAKSYTIDGLLIYG